jgi:hypothetical protein
MSSWSMIKMRLPSAARDVVGLSGVSSIAYGAWLINPAAAFIVGGVLASCGAIALAWIEGKSGSDS